MSAPKRRFNQEFTLEDLWAWAMEDDELAGITARVVLLPQPDNGSWEVICQLVTVDEGGKRNVVAEGRVRWPSGHWKRVESVMLHAMNRALQALREKRRND